MLLFLVYLLKCVTFAGIFFGYYYIALRNRLMHRYNRFYLLLQCRLVCCCLC